MAVLPCLVLGRGEKRPIRMPAMGIGHPGPRNSLPRLGGSCIHLTQWKCQSA